MRTQEHKQLVTCERLTSGEPKCDFARRRSLATGAAFGTQFGRRRGEHLAHGVVELPNAAKARCEGDIGEGHCSGLDEQSRRVRPMGPGDSERACTEFVGHDSVEMTFAVSELLRQARHAVSLDSAIRDQAHRSADQILSEIPLRRSRRRVGTTPLARSEPPLLCSGRGVMELDVRLLRGDRWATGAAVDTRCTHCCHEPPVEAPVGVLDDAVAPIVVKGWHDSMMPVNTDNDQRKSASQLPV